MNIIALLILLAVLVAPSLLYMLLTRVSDVLYSGPATILPLAFRPNRDGMYQVAANVPGMDPVVFEVSASRFDRVRRGENKVMVSVGRRFLDRRPVLSQILWQYEAKDAAAVGRYDKLAADLPVDQDLGLVPGMLYFVLAMATVVLFVGDGYVPSLMRSDPLVMHAFWYGNAACVALSGYWLARTQPAIRGYLSEGGSRGILMTLFSLIGGMAALATVLFYEEPSAVTLLGAICASAVGMLFAMLTGSRRSHPSSAEPIRPFAHTLLAPTAPTAAPGSADLLAAPDQNRDARLGPPRS